MEPTPPAETDRPVEACDAHDLGGEAPCMLHLLGDLETDDDASEPTGGATPGE